MRQLFDFRISWSVICVYAHWVLRLVWSITSLLKAVSLSKAHFAYAMKRVPVDNHFQIGYSEQKLEMV